LPAYAEVAEVITAGAVAACVLGLTLYQFGWEHIKKPLVSPDGMGFLEMALGVPQPASYHARWLLPKVLGTNVHLWQAATWTSLIMTAMVLAGMAGTPVAGILFVGLPIFRWPSIFPVLADAPAFLYTALAVWAATTGGYGFWVAIVMVLIGGCIKEQVPVFAAAAAWEPWLLLGLIPLGIRMVFFRQAMLQPRWATNPFKYAREVHVKIMFDAKELILPWGACLVCLLATPSPELILSMALAYGMLFFASDVTRNYGWAFIPVCLGAALVIPPAWALPVLIAHLFNPWRGRGMRWEGP
jgi:hypothetical protein